jgi:hypothetical protein
VVLSRKDLIVNTKAVRAYLTKGRVIGREDKD